MIGALIGDVVGSRFEYLNNRNKDFPLFHRVSTFTDDSVCSIAVAKALLDNESKDKLSEDIKESLIYYAKKYPDRGYGPRFYDWVFYDEKHNPYNSCGNGSAMRVASVGWLDNSLEEAKELARISASVTHNHIEGIRGAEAVAACIYMARNNYSKEEIKEYIYDHYYLMLDYFEYDELLKYNNFDSTCQGSVPEAIYCFLISDSFEDALRIAVSIGGDSDTIACITGAIAEAYYHNEKETRDVVEKFLSLKIIPDEFVEVVNRVMEGK